MKVKLQAPMQKTTYDAMCQRAEDLGFDSLQAYIRYWAASETKSQNMVLDDVSTRVLRYVEIMLILKRESLKSVDDGLTYLVREINKVRARRDSAEIFKNLHYLP